MSGTVAERLAVELMASLQGANPPRRVLLWFDPAREFERLVSDVAKVIEPDGEVVRHDTSDSQIAQKVDLLRREAAATAPTVVFLPGRAPDSLRPRGTRGDQRPELWALADYRYKARVWCGGAEGDGYVSLLTWLERQGVQPSFGRHEADLVSGGTESILARYVEMHVATDPAAWPRPLRADDVRKRLAGDPTDAALLLIASPRTADSKWGERTSEVLRAISHEYGIDDGGAAAVAECAERMISALALTDAWDAFGRRDDFPFASALPSSEKQRNSALKLLRGHVLLRQDIAPRYHDAVAVLSAKWGPIGPWAVALQGQPLGMRQLAIQRVGELVGGLDIRSAQERVDAMALLREAVASWPSTREEWVEPMRAVALAVDLLDLIADAGAALDAFQVTSMLVDAYGRENGWHQIDGTYLRLRAATATQPSLATLQTLADHAYVDWVSAVNDRFAKLVEDSDVWPPPETELCPAPEWMASSTNRRAVVVTDALRLDLARSLVSRLADAELEPGMTTLPTTTPFGMAALLPHGGELAAKVDKTKVILRDGSSKHDLQTREGRRAWLTDALNSRGQTVAYVELGDLLAGGRHKPADLTVVFDYRLDDAGHGQGSVADEVEGHVSRLTRAVQRLHELGVSTVDVVTDHGFLYLPPDLVEALGKPPVQPAQVHARTARYAVLKPDAPVDSLIRLTSPLVPSVHLGFPRGIRTLVKPDEYLHGGLSLQECVIGRIRSARSLGPASLGITVGVPTTELPTGTIAVNISPAQNEQTTLTPPPPRRLLLWLASSGRDVSDRLDVEVRWDAPPQTFALYLREGAGIAAGTRIELRVEDAETHERLHTEQLRLLIDWE